MSGQISVVTIFNAVWSALKWMCLRRQWARWGLENLSTECLQVRHGTQWIQLSVLLIRMGVMNVYLFGAVAAVQIISWTKLSSLKLHLCVSKSSDSAFVIFSFHQANNVQYILLATASNSREWSNMVAGGICIMSSNKQVCILQAIHLCIVFCFKITVSWNDRTKQKTAQNSIV